MDVLVAVNEIRRSPEGRLERGKLARSFGRQRIRIEAPPQSRRERVGEAQECAVAGEESACASAAEKLGAVTITEVALIRPRPIRPRMARLTAGEMP